VHAPDPAPRSEKEERGVRLVILDLDLTLWDHRNVSGLALPFRRVSADAVEDQHGVRVTLFPGVHSLLNGLRERNLIVACASWNDPEPVDEIFDLLALGEFFDHRKVEPHPHKERLVAALLQSLRAAGQDLAPSEILYVDDRRIHLDGIYAAVGQIRFLQFGVDIRRPDEVLAFLDRLRDAAHAPRQ
jgi:magnesium-dependent phosphatase-1